MFKHTYRDDFFGLLRGWHNRRATKSLWERFNFLIAHSTEPTLFIKDLHQSPFNVGHIFRLADFDRDEILWLNERHGLPLKSTEDLERLIWHRGIVFAPALADFAATLKKGAQVLIQGELRSR